MKNKTILVLGIAIAATFLGGCATYRTGAAPTPVRFNNGIPGEQLKIQALKHWQLIAEDLAKSAAKEVSGKELIVTSIGSTVFDTTFNKFLTTALVQAGARVNLNQAATRVSVESIQIRFRNNRNPDPLPGSFTALTAGLLVLNGAVNWSSGGLAAGAIALGAAADIGTVEMVKYAGSIPQTEIAVTVTASDAGRIIFRKTNIYYTDEIDARLYETQGPGIRVVNQ